MFPLSDPEFQLDLYHQRSTEWRRAAAADHLAHEAAGGHPRRTRWPWSHRRSGPARAPVAP